MQLSQFWYSDDTALRICEEVEAALKGEGESGKEVEMETSAASGAETATLALVSTPTLLPFAKKLEVRQRASHVKEKVDWVEIVHFAEFHKWPFAHSPPRVRHAIWTRSSKRIRSFRLSQSTTGEG